MELAATRPRNNDDLNKSRLLLRDARKGQIAEGILYSIKQSDKYTSNDIERQVPKKKDLKVKKGFLSCYGFF